jgi:hypothetical protein
MECWNSGRMGKMLKEMMEEWEWISFAQYSNIPFL